MKLLKNLITIATLLCCTMIYAQVGIGTTTPQNQLDVNGWLKLGDETNTTGNSVEGSIRYNSINKCMQFHDGSTWQCIGGPKMQTIVVKDGIDETSSFGDNSDFFTWEGGGYGVQQSFTVNNVSPEAKMIFIVEIVLGNGGDPRENGAFNGLYKITQGGVIFAEYDLPFVDTFFEPNETATFTLTGTTINAVISDLVFVFECNGEYNNVKITAIHF